MKQYELLIIVPGTLTEEEVAPHVAGAKELLAQVEATDVVESFLGKAKLAYPMKHIRYGYFYTLTFTAEPSVLPGLQQKLRLQKVLLRTLINEVTPVEKLRDNTPKELVTIEKRQDLVDERKKAVAKFKGETLSTEVKKVDISPKKEAKKAPVKEKKESSEESVSMEDIDKKLDNILTGEDITKNV